MAPTTDLAVRAPATELVDTLIRNDESALAQLRGALPENVTLTKFTAALQTALIDDAIRQQDASKQLVNADRASLFQAVVKCAGDGLLPDGRQAALTVFGGKVTYLPMIAGVRHIAAEFGWTIRTHVVYANDRFEVIEGTDQRVEHRPVPPGAERGEIVAAYAVAHHRDGRTSIVEVMHKVDIDKCRAVAKTQNVWAKWPAQMSEKTVGHRIAKKLPLDPQDAQRLMRVLDAAELAPGEAATLLYSKPASEEHVHAASSTDTEAGKGPQAGGVVEHAAAASPVPGTDDRNDFGGGEETVATADVAMELAQAAAGYVVTVPKEGNWVNGLTLAQINSRGDDGVLFFRWALKRSSAEGANHNEQLRKAATEYAQVQLPFLYAELVEVTS